MKYLLNPESLVQAAHDTYNPRDFNSLWKILGNNKNIQMNSVAYEYIANINNGFLYKWCKKNFKDSQLYHLMMKLFLNMEF